MRVQVAPTRFRIPDVCATAADLARERIVRTPPLLCVEVLSPRDTLTAMRARVQDFLDMVYPPSGSSTPPPAPPTPSHPPA